MPAAELPSFAAVARFPQLYAQVADSLAAQQRQATRCLQHAIPRPDLLNALDHVLDANMAGVIVLEGPAGSGVTTLLCQLARTRHAVLWLPSDDAGAGLEALCAQVIALYNLPVPLLPPATGRDATTIERVLNEAAALRTNPAPLLVLIDDVRSSRHGPLLPPLPLSLPAGVVAILGTTPGTTLPIRPLARVNMPRSGNELEQQLVQASQTLNLPAPLATTLAAHADGSFLYLRLAANILKQGMLTPSELPKHLSQLLLAWWERLDRAAQQSFILLAVTGEPLTPSDAATLLNQPIHAIQPFIQRWQGFLEQATGITIADDVVRTFVTRRAPEECSRLHARLAQICSAQLANGSGPISSGYVIRQIARHIALSDARTRAALAPTIEQRSWVIAQERRTGTHRAAAADLAWCLRAAKDGPPLRLVRTAALTGTLALLARGLAPDAVGEALTATLASGAAREPALRRARALIDQLPNGRDKALALRRLGDVCYAHGMRTPAMRMLSEALDLETTGLPRSWRDEREEALVALARAAISNGSPDTALGITTLILHAERRGMIDTEVVRHLLARGERTRAEEVAYAIAHAGTHEWAMAEVAVGHARAHDAARAEEVLATLRTATARAWAIGELAGDAARVGQIDAAQRVLEIANTPLRDRALTQVAQAFASGTAPAQALVCARQIHDPELRVRALAAVAEISPRQATGALAEAEQAIGLITGEERASIVAALAAAYAAAGPLDHAMQSVETLPPGEERDRAQARVAVALARRGDSLAAHTVAFGIQDNDERAWALEELARQVAAAGQWESSFQLAGQILDLDQRARAEADLAITWARAGDPLAAHHHADQIAHIHERVRALAAIAEPLVAADYAAQLRPAILRTPGPDLRSRYQAAAAAALANHGAYEEARRMITQIARPTERARALVAVARAAGSDRQRAIRALADALRETARLGRAETLTCIAWAAEPLIQLGRADLLLSIASALDEIDGWWA